jgi:hypothetical protein
MAHRLGHEQLGDACFFHPGLLALPQITAPTGSASRHNGHLTLRRKGSEGRAEGSFGCPWVVR